MESSSCFTEGWVRNPRKDLLAEVRKQRPIALPLIVMNLTWFAKIAITTAFLGRLGGLQLAGGTLAFTFANVTGFSVLAGLCGAMEPICGQAYGAGNCKLLHKTLLMATLLLLLATLPISLLWFYIDKILMTFGLQEDISAVAKSYAMYLLPDLAVTSFLCPLKAYLSSQSITVPIMFSSALALGFHVPINSLLCKAKALEGVAMAVWITDLFVVILLGNYVWVMERREGKKRWNEGGWWDQGLKDWAQLLKLCGPCCLTTCLEWWCYEIMVLLAGHMTDPNRAVSILAIVLNFDYLLYSVMLSLATTVSIRVSNELGANRMWVARRSAYLSLGGSILAGFIGGAVMVAARREWAGLYSHDEGIIRGVKKTMLLMALVEVINFPLAVSGGIVRGTARPCLAMYANLGGFYLLALPLAVVLAFWKKLGLGGLLLGFLAGMIISAVLLIVMVSRIDWVEEAGKAQKLASASHNVNGDAELKIVANDQDNNNKEESLECTTITPSIFLL
ncbi:protein DETOXIFICATION 56-like [Aristolochia californica]|uniref:protein DETOXIFICATION 56-like n=1 Tax=Aristolochia californica TaxID=171875 RepID=UPI0035DE7D52